MRYYGTILFFIALLLPALGKSQKSEEQLKKELKQLQKGIDNTGIVNNTIQELEKNYKIAKNNKYDIAFRIGAELVRTYSTLDNAEKVIDVSTDLESSINKNSPPYDVSNMYRMKARSLGDLGFLEDSHKAYQASRRYMEKIKNNDARHYYGSLFYSNYSSFFDHSKKQSDSVRLCLLKGLDEAEKISDKSDLVSQNQKYDLIASIQGNLALYYLWIMKPGEPKTAEKYLLKSLKIAETKEISSFNEMNLYRTAGDFYFDQKDHDKAILYAQKGLDLERKISSPASREIFYEVLMDAYLAKNNSEEGKKYSLLLTELKDSIKTAEKHSVNKVTNAIKKGKDIEKNNILKTYLYIFLAAIIIGCGGVWYYWKKRNKLLQQRFHELIEKIKNESEDKNAGKEKDKQKVIGAPIAMSEETINQLLDKISKFERSEKYLKTDLTLAKLAVSFNTNTKYLSEVIKYHKNKNFNNYINSLRIGYITRKLYEDSTYRRYKISSLAEICGYSSFRAFQTVFKKETGLTPSDFIENLKKEMEVQ
ncbi:helix-turn-helix domain-containing protein [Chryseobacterium rhizoplanae]|uniref:helix-turn-helix domain-containing protein n=1 Tax=Chryseobacterium rhizoplanae TaxID=1609531 RepID=UPI001CE3AD94|nr:helix-turn-helix domain-containing protein [Chryseobacterium rhizoplanae]UCA61197.1 helix-turn-helix domain-containing protein [Chryseobacterium rhizoplanae]